MNTPQPGPQPAPGAYLNVPGHRIGDGLRAVDRIADLGTVIVWLSDSGLVTIHVDDAQTARAFAAVFTKAADLHDAAAQPAPEDDPPGLSRDLSGDLDAIPPNRIGEEGE